MVTNYLFIGIVIFAVIFLTCYTFKPKKNNFLFEVSPNKPKCSAGYIGLPHLNFNYVPDFDRMSMSYCNDTNAYNQAKLLKTPRDERQEKEILEYGFLW